ncbi:Uncharacterised protein [uncultured archaeon]|nr:Uncharacterised protein [uncultured archaeon]
MVLVKLPKKKDLNAFITEEFQKGKDQKNKIEEIHRQILVTKKALSKEKEFLEGKSTFKEIVVKSKQWFEIYRHMVTSNGFLVLSGANAQENEKLVSKYLQEDDLFFHSDIHGASVCVLKTEGKIPSEQDLLEAAQFAACYSSAWKNSFGVIDVYCVKGNQVFKHSHGEVVAKGSFVMRGERTWFRNMELKLVLSGSGDSIIGEPFVKNNKGIVIVPGRTEKKRICETLLLKLKANNIDIIYKIVPGNSEILSR